MKFSIAIIAAVLLAVPAFAQKHIKTIRVERIVSGYPYEQDMADLVTAKIITHLVAHGVFVIEGDSETNTDAVLKVTYTMRHQGDVGYHLEGPVRLTDMNGRVVWADEAKSGAWVHSASTSFAEAIALKVEDFMSKQGQK